MMAAPVVEEPLAPVDVPVEPEPPVVAVPVESDPPVEDGEPVETVEFLPVPAPLPVPFAPPDLTGTRVELRPARGTTLVTTRVGAPAGTVASVVMTAGWVRIAVGWVVTGFGWPVTTPRELVRERYDVKGLVYAALESWA